MCIYCFLGVKKYSRILSKLLQSARTCDRIRQNNRVESHAFSAFGTGSCPNDETIPLGFAVWFSHPADNTRNITRAWRKPSKVDFYPIAHAFPYFTFPSSRMYFLCLGGIFYAKKTTRRIGTADRNTFAPIRNRNNTRQISCL